MFKHRTNLGIRIRHLFSFQNEVEELKDKIAELQRNLKQAKRVEETLHAELKKVLEENEKKEQTIKK